ncbi:MAG: hypothetical protein D6724_05495 [Armatimonadetes bacterium]|nr:MAG: hypothetical protein D6724_05495 [Armatimonadota bacterium]
MQIQTLLPLLMQTFGERHPLLMHVVGVVPGRQKGSSGLAGAYKGAIRMPIQPATAAIDSVR